MDTKSLRIFLHLSESLSFSRTSEAYHMSPSTLSRHIKQMEDVVGYPLFLRDNRSVHLTPEGEKFIIYAKESLGAWEHFQQSLANQFQELAGEISLYCSVTASYSFLYTILSEFRGRYPKIELKVHTGDPVPAMERVLNRLEDISIAARPNHVPTNLAFKRIAISPLVFIAPKDPQALRALNANEVGKVDWATVPMIVSEDGIARVRVDQWFKQQQVKPNIYAQVSGNEAIVSMVALGFGIGVVPTLVLDNSPLVDSVQILKVSPELEAFDVGLFTLKKSLANPIIKAFWDQITD
ncbi:HTH-type transcriptional activator IlvY [Maribrevibacterium harenarium]|uniref:HTH-type transcriptional activator IlvY n=1 Tax=Maribrevibacterium harenarium TaxID=2589817 RepID=A0A501WWH1_9GAMM|nr:HTH-type transcriptional activator IlvY [Maribrevibacterium harenarium]TPE52780.1 HTH-type transcriptional activator IlvY [Maribrevibacterium harenarium]